MRVMRALEVRARFGEVLDTAAHGERIVVERAGQPIAAIVPLADLDAVDPERLREHRKAAFEQLRRQVKRAARAGAGLDSVAFIRADRERGHSA